MNNLNEPYDYNGVSTPVAEVHQHRPIWIRLPKPGTHCAWTGLSRSKLNELVLPCRANGFKPPVKSHCLRKPGAFKGTRLVHLQSLIDYVETFVEGGQRL